MRTRILAVTATLVLAVLGATVPVAQGAVPTIAGPTCEYRGEPWNTTPPPACGTA